MIGEVVRDMLMLSIGVELGARMLDMIDVGKFIIRGYGIVGSLL